jgi:hypothetical protein
MKKRYQKPLLKSNRAFNDAVLVGDCTYFNENWDTCLKAFFPQCQAPNQLEPPCTLFPVRGSS